MDFLLLQIRVPDIAENGAVVPIEVPEIKAREGTCVTEIALHTDYRFDQPLASFKFGPDRVPYVWTRLKLEKSTHIYVVARWSDGLVTGGMKQIKVTIGGCGGGGFYGGYQQTNSAPVPIAPNYDLAQRERYAAIESDAVRLAAEHPVSTFSIDVDSAAYANVRRFLKGGNLPPVDAVESVQLLAAPRLKGLRSACGTNVAGQSGVLGRCVRLHDGAKSPAETRGL